MNQTKRMQTVSWCWESTGSTLSGSKSGCVGTVWKLQTRATSASKNVDDTTTLSHFSLDADKIHHVITLQIIFARTHHLFSLRHSLIAFFFSSASTHRHIYNFVDKLTTSRCVYCLCWERSLHAHQIRQDYHKPTCNMSLYRPFTISD